MIEAQDLNIKQCTKVTIAIQNAWCYCVIYDEQKGATTQMSLHYFFFFFFIREDRTEYRQEPEPVPSSSGMQDIEAGPLSPVANDPSALPTVCDLLSCSSEWLFWPVHLMPAPVYQLLCFITVLFKVLHGKI